mgnify:CR=1 FL=1
MIKMKKILQSSLLILLATALLFSCKKDISNIGVDVVGENPLQVIYMDTITIHAHSELVDTLRTDELSSHVMGAYKDPVFGTMNASLYSEFHIAETDYDFGSNPQIDSIVLYIAYAENEVYGDTNYVHNWDVYELGEDMFVDTSYYSFQNLRTKNEIIGQVEFRPNFDSIDYYEIEGSDTLVEERRMRPVTIYLDNDLGQRLIDYDSAVYADNESFKEMFKGIYITTPESQVPSSGGSLVNIDFENDQTYIRLYYHNDNYDSLTYNLVVNFSTARFSNFNHYDYQDADPDFRAQVIDGDTTLGNEKIYLQGLGGVRTILSFTHLNKMDDYYNYAVNEAKLFLWDVDETSNLAAIESLTLSHKVEFDSTINHYTIQDASSGDRYFSGDYNGDEKRYYFRITQYIQSLIKGDTYDNELRVEIIGGAIWPNRVVLGGGSPMINGEKKVALQILYTKIDQD